MRMKRDEWYRTVLCELEKMHKKKEISPGAYQEMNHKYEEKLKEWLEEEEKDLESKLEEVRKEIAALGAGVTPGAPVSGGSDRTRIYK
jgi:hypothetical protein